MEILINVFAVARVTMYITIVAWVSLILALVLLKPDLIPDNAAWFSLGIAVMGALILFCIARL